MENSLHFILVSIVWGKQYIDLFLDCVLPSYLSTQNIPLAAKRFHLSAQIFTTPQEAEQIAKNPNYLQLQKFIDCRILPVIDQTLLESDPNKYSVKGYCQSLAIQNAMKQQAVVLLLNPDSLVSDGGITHCCSLISQGYKAVLIGELARVELESIRPHLLSYYNAKTRASTFPSRDLVELGIAHLHEIGKNLFWKGETFTKWPSIIYWRAGKKSLLAKFFHLHPMAIDVRNVRKKLPQTLMTDDAGLIQFLGIQPHEIHRIVDSENLVCIEISSKAMHPGSSTTCPAKEKKWSLFLFSLKRISSSDMDQFLHCTLKFQGNEQIDWAPIHKDISASLAPLKPLLIGLQAYHQVKEHLRALACRLGLRYLKRRLQNAGRRALYWTKFYP